ncbi:hypothetical protein EXH46_27385 [Pelomonas puraquae]|uniref:DNA-binding protein H-NS-like C-terminal domain-containing protein n=2 Tax=Roseateles puraquae TaxID=431059 RepID=A0A254MXG1_9BURK|nr:hypothetical protein [Roseateles puraquae]OWQ96491.1 hypothetical protein CDO81_27145 [Roseateles puraquae]
MSQIERLQKQAAAIQNEVITRIRKDIAKYGLTAEQLFGSVTSRTAATKAVTKQAKPTKAPKYGDGAGNTWGGMGKRPAWIHEALAAGKSLEDFLIAKPAATKASATKSAKAPVKRNTGSKANPTAKKRPAAKAAGKRAPRAKADGASEAA